MDVCARDGNATVAERLFQHVDRCASIQGMAGMGMPHPMRRDLTRHTGPTRRREQGTAAATINGEVVVLSTMFTRANKLKLTTRHPVKGVGKLRVNRKERYLTHEEIHCLLAATSGDLHDMVTVALGTGMRASEVLTLDHGVSRISFCFS
jgi:integrase